MTRSAFPWQLRLYSFCPTTLEEAIPFPRTLRFVVAVSGATAQKGAERLADYNNAALLARWAADAAMAGEAIAESGGGDGESNSGGGGGPHRFAGVVR
eukprot:4800686-Prymnesium_polylepis.2